MNTHTASAAAAIALRPRATRRPVRSGYGLFLEQVIRQQTWTAETLRTEREHLDRLAERYGWDHSTTGKAEAIADLLDALAA